MVLVSFNQQLSSSGGGGGGGWGWEGDSPVRVIPSVGIENEI